MFKTLKNAWKIEDLRKKLIYTLMIIVIFRVGVAIPVPYLDASVLKDMVNATGSMLGYINLLTGGAFAQATLFALSVTPYINASIIIQLLAVAIPFFLPHMHDRYFFAADALTLALAAAWPQLVLPAVLCEFASLLGYHAYLRMRYLLPMADGALALIAALVILTVVLALELRQRSPLNGKIKKST